MAEHSGRAEAALAASSPHRRDEAAQEVANSVRSALFGGSAPQRRIGRYVVRGLLGEGGMGVVYRAHDPELDREVALKLLALRRLQRHTAEVERARLMREARAIAALSHPNLVRVYDVGVDEGRIYIAMERVDGPTLESAVEATTPWREIVAMYLQAARGLEAAHAAGIVHRDFKAGNAMRGADGRVRVLDFGLAIRPDSLDLSTQERHASTDPSQRAADPESGSSPAVAGPGGDGAPGQSTGRLTEVGAAVGTPASMAPEQHTGGAIDERTDVYAFCVALFSALYRHLPFGGASPAALLRAKEEYRLASPGFGARSDVPRGVVSVLRRGLEPAPSDRPQSMREVVTRLEAAMTRPRGRNRIAIVAGALGLTAFGVWAAGRSEAAGPAEQCEQRLTPAAPWGAQLRDAARRGVEGTGHPRAADAWTRIDSRLVAYREAWLDASREVCAAPSDAGESCLRDRAAAADALATVLAAADGTTVLRGPAAVLALPRLDGCNQAEDATARPIPQDPALARRVAEVRGQIAETMALGRADRFRDAEALAAKVAEAAAELEYPPLILEAQRTRASLTARSADPESAYDALTEVFWRARETGYDLEALGAARTLVEVVTHRLHRVDEGLEWVRHTEASLARMGDPPEQRSAANISIGIAMASAGRFEEAERYMVDARRIGEALYGDDPPFLELILSNLSGIAREQMQLPRAEALAREALEAHARRFGADHPGSASARMDLAGALHLQGRTAEALVQMQAALPLYEELHGETHPVVAGATLNTATLAGELDRYAEAERLFTRAIEMLEGLYGPKAPHLVLPLYAKAYVHLRQDDYETGRALARRAIETARAGSHNPIELAGALVAAAQIERAAGSLDRAETFANEALEAIGEVAPAHRHGVESRSVLARVAIARGQLDEGARLIDDAEAGLAEGAESPWLIEARRELSDARSSEVEL